MAESEKITEPTRERADDVTSSSDLAKDRISRNGPLADSFCQTYLRARARMPEPAQPLGTAWPPPPPPPPPPHGSLSLSLPRRPQSFSSSSSSSSASSSSSSSAFNEFSRPPGLSPLTPQALWLSESYPPAKGYHGAERGFSLSSTTAAAAAAAAASGLSGALESPTAHLLPFWSLQPGAAPPALPGSPLEATGAGPLKLNLSVPFDDHFERLKQILHSSIAKRFGKDKGGSQRGEEDSCYPEASERMKRAADGGGGGGGGGGESLTDTDEMDTCCPLPLNLIRERSGGNQQAKKDASLARRGHSEDSDDGTDSDATTGKNASEASPGLAPGAFPAPMTSSGVTSPLSSPSAYTSLILSHISALQSQSPYAQAGTPHPHPHLYPYSPASYPMTSPTAALQIPNPGALPVSGSAGLQPVIPGGGAGQSRLSGGPHGLSFYPPGFVLGGVTMGRRASLDKPPAVKKYKCDECGKAFSRSNTLVTHKRIHTGDKPFECERCGRAFRQPGNLTRHRLTHTTHKPYVCSQCGKAFNRASNLNTHMRTHANIRPFLCSICHKQFHHKNDWRLHMYSHGEQSTSLAAVLRH